MSSALRAAATDAGGSAAEKIPLRASWRMWSITGALPATKPPTVASDFENVPISRSTSSSTPKCSGVPRPHSPNTPSPCASSTIRRAPCARASRAISGSGATSPSIENTPSTTIRMPEPLGNLAELAREIGHVVVAVLHGAAEAEPAAVDDAGVIERVEHGHVAAAEQARQHAEVHLEAGREDERGLAPRELREPLLELDVEVERAVEQPRARHAGAVDRERDGGRLLDLGMVREAEVVVRPEHHELAVAAQHDRILGRRERPVVGIHPGGARIDHARPDLAALREDVHSPFHSPPPIHVVGCDRWGDSPSAMPRRVPTTRWSARGG